MSRVEQRIAHIYGQEVNPLSVTGYVEAPLAYDAVWALALALNNSQSRFVFSAPSTSPQYPIAPHQRVTLAAWRNG